MGLLTGSVRAKERREIYEALRRQHGAGGGNARHFSERGHLCTTGLVITDEQHRFGVAQRTLLADKGGCPTSWSCRQRRFHGHWH
ncbi:MAG: hypothetical protein ACLT3Y_08410 [Ruminococcus callidus]